MSPLNKLLFAICFYLETCCDVLVLSPRLIMFCYAMENRPGDEAIVVLSLKWQLVLSKLVPYNLSVGLF